MKIVFYKSNEMLPNIGGISRINCNLKDALQTLGIQVIFLSSKRRNDIVPLENQCWLPDVEVENSDENIEYLHNLIIKEGVNVIINNNFSITSIKYLDTARKNTRASLVTWIHNNIVEYSSKMGFRYEVQLCKKKLTFVYKIITSDVSISLLRTIATLKHHKTAKALYDLSDRVVTVCEGNVKEFIYLLRQPDKQNKLYPISNFVPPLSLTPAINEKDKTVVWCGTIDFDLKKTNWMLQIWKSVEQKEPDWNLYILGDSRDFNRMKGYANNLGLKNIHFEGRVNPENYYRRASILCSTSISESFGLTLVEGMQQGVVPIAFASSPSIREIVSSNGVLVTPFNKKEYVEKMVSLMQNDDERRMLGVRCREASHQYAAEKIAHVWESLFNELNNFSNYNGIK